MAGKCGPDIIENGLVLALDAANKNSYPGSGTSWKDLSGNDNNGTLTNGPTFNAGNIGSIVFDGTNDFVQSTNNTSLQINQGTVISWIKTSTNDTTYRAIVTKVYNYGFFLRNSFLVIWDWGNLVERSSGINIATGNWINVAMTFSNNTGTPSNNVILYVNAKSVLTTTSKFQNDTYPLVLGTGDYQNATSQPFNGNIATTQVYNRALTATEILQNYNATKSRFGY